MLNEYEEAEQYFQESLKISEEIDQIREMLATLYYIARVWVAQEKKTEALRLLAVVLKHPTSDQHLLMRTEHIPLRDAAEHLRAKLEQQLGPATYQAAWERGTGLELEVVVMELIERRRSE